MSNKTADQKIDLVRAEVIALTGCVISIFGAFGAVRAALTSQSIDTKILKDLETEVDELSTRLGETIALLKKFGE